MRVKDRRGARESPSPKKGSNKYKESLAPEGVETNNGLKSQKSLESRSH